MFNSDLEVLGVKELHQKMKWISERVLEGQEFLVMKSSKPIFKIVPCEVKKRKGKTTLQDFLKLSSKTGDKNLSKNMDTILYLS